MKRKFVMRLDDASPYMAREKWAKIERILDRYSIQPIVGIVPDCTDGVIMYEPFDPDFFSITVERWKNKNWTIAQHGLHHKCFIDEKTGATEFASRPYEKQAEDIRRGYELLCAENCTPVCFFAPCHTYDENTVRACADSELFDFISDGVSFRPYSDNGTVFLPNMFDTPKNIPLPGVYTFVCHPSNTDDEYCDFLDGFLSKHSDKFVNAEKFMNSVRVRSGRGFFGGIAEKALKTMRKIRKL